VYGSVENKGCVLSDEELNVIKTASAHIYFETGSAKIKNASYADLDRLVAILKKHPEVKARIEGHTDSSGNAAKNLSLSKARAKSVADYLVSHGEPQDHISSEGYGITKPVATNDTKEGRAENRRVAIVVSSFGH
jgi:outer membrane protein OmpA-like peptidoglycan-associated protein